MLDLVGFDAWPATYCIHQAAAGWLVDQTCWWNCLIVFWNFDFLWQAFSIFAPSGKKVACATACHSAHEASFAASCIAQKTYSMARANTLKLPGFPKFDSVVQEISNQKEIEAPQYEVCVGLANGLLAVKENLIEYWSKDDNLFSTEMAALVKAHNKKYNPKGVKRGSSQPAATQECQPAKKVKVEASVKPLEKESEMQDKSLGDEWSFLLFRMCFGGGFNRLVLIFCIYHFWGLLSLAELLAWFMIGTKSPCSFIWRKRLRRRMLPWKLHLPSSLDLEVESMLRALKLGTSWVMLLGDGWISSWPRDRRVSLQRRTNDWLITSGRLICLGKFLGFWIGSFLFWVFVVAYFWLIISHSLPLSKVITFNEMLATLQNMGEINLKVSTHVSDKQEGGGVLFRSEKTVCFALDPPKEGKKKKANMGFSFLLSWSVLSKIFTSFRSRYQLTFQCQVIFSLQNLYHCFHPLQVSSSATTFGSKINLGKLRTSQNIKVIWRMRLGGRTIFEIHN